MNSLPKNWSEVSVDKFSQLKLMNDTNPSLFKRHIEILTILTNTYEEEWYEMDIIELFKKTHQLTWLRHEPTKDFKRVLDNFRCVDIQSITLGEFIDLEYYFINDLFTNLNKIFATIYRKYKLDKFGNVKMESLGSYDFNERCEYFNQVPIENVWGFIYEFASFKTNLLETYNTLFQQEPTAEEIAEYEELEDEYPLTPEELEAEKREEIFKKWSWETIVNRLANDDVTKYDAVLNMSVIFVFNQLSFMKDIQPISSQN